ncbi:MAG TPA: class I SAM-dependent methyltransferase [Candidatus Limiplasma sp.]|nr:class I SAM-dependent methyltransferase [Candidatus Limiplasma sp.]
MDYFKTNQQAWEEAFANRRAGWGDDLVQRLTTERLPYLNSQLRQALPALELDGKVIAQFCCNNGREILSAMQLGAAAGVGFDIAENMIKSAREAAQKAGLPCRFEACNILTIGSKYTAAFDLVFFTIGAITWFQDLQALFAVAARCLKAGGTLLINDFHPFVNMLPLPGEAAFDSAFPDRVAYSYFRTEPWLETNGADYMTAHINSHTFTSFSHTMGGIVNAVIAAGLRIVSLDEYAVDIGMTDAYDGKGFPLSYTLLAAKPTD